MKRLACFFSSALLLLTSCSSKINNGGKLLHPTNIITQRFSINPVKDTILKGLRGGIFRISKGSFAGSSPINIEIKEVYSPIEIVYAGLVTESNGRLLESGGMVYFNVFNADNKPTELLKPVDVSIPSNYINENMQLFKGDEQPDGSINWTDPQPLSLSMDPCLDRGKSIFEGRCKACHAIFTDLTGPALAGVEERVKDRSLLKAYIRNPGKVTSANSYFMCLKNKFGSLMAAYPMLTDRDIDCFLDYVKSETVKRPDLVIKRPDLDTFYVDTTSAVESNMDTLLLGEGSGSAVSAETLLREGFTDPVITDGLYNFKIETMGWYNVDAYLEPLEGTQKVDLFVKTDFPNNLPILDVHVFFPARKVLTIGTYDQDGLFHFEKYEGQIPLFVNDNAVAFASTSIGEKIYYGITSFTVAQKQTISLHVKEGTKEQLSQAFREMELDGVKLDIITKKRVIRNACSVAADTSLSVK